MLSRGRTLLMVGAVLPALLLAAAAHAGTKQYVRASVIIEAFGNTSTNGTAYPFNTPKKTERAIKK